MYLKIDAGFRDIYDALSPHPSLTALTSHYTTGDEISGDYADRWLHHESCTFSTKAVSFQVLVFLSFVILSYYVVAYLMHNTEILINIILKPHIQNYSL